MVLVYGHRQYLWSLQHCHASLQTITGYPGFTVDNCTALEWLEVLPGKDQHCCMARSGAWQCCNF